MSEHPCPTPDIHRKGSEDGRLWACTCGKVYVLRRWRNYAGEGFEWTPTSLRAEEA